MVRPLSASALLAALAIIAAMPAGAAAPRRPLETMVRRPPPPTPVDMDIWLRRLVGRFRWEGMLDTSPATSSEDGSDLLRVHGMGDCVAVGVGPGVQCVLDVKWLDDWSLQGGAIAVPNLTPAMSLYGIDAVRERFVYMQVDNKGLALGGPGTLYGSTATMRAPCIGTDLPMQVTPTPGTSEAASPESAAGSNRGTDSPGGSDGGSGGGLSSSAPAGPSYRTPINSISEEPGPATGCLWTTRIIARPDKDLIWVNIDYGDRVDPTNRFTLSLYRVNPPDK